MKCQLLRLCGDWSLCSIVMSKDVAFVQMMQTLVLYFCVGSHADGMSGKRDSHQQTPLFYV